MAKWLETRINIGNKIKAFLKISGIECGILNALWAQTALWPDGLIINAISGENGLLQRERISEWKKRKNR